MLFNRGLTPPACWTSVHFYGIFLRGKNCLPFVPWEPRVPAPKSSLGPRHWSDPDAAGAWKGTAEECGGFLQHWLIGVRMKLGVTFLDSDPPLSHFLSIICFCSTPFIPPAVRFSWCLCFMCPVQTMWSSTGCRQYYTRLALCLTSAERLMNSLQRINLNRNL